MANLLLNLIGQAAQWSQRRFIRQTEHTAERQRSFLQALLHAQRETVLAQDWGLPSVQTIADFRAQIPITCYRDYEAYVDRAFKGEANVMTAEPPIYFSLTSGSTGNRKVLPITKRSRQAVSQANQVAMGFAVAAARWAGRPLGRMLYTNSARPFGVTPQGIAYGPISVGDINLLGPIYQQVFAYPVSVLTAKESLTRNYLALLFALRDRALGLVSATFPIYALTFCQYLDTYAESLLQDLETGTIADWLSLEPELRAQITRHWQPHRDRAQELKAIWQATGSLRPKDVWPQLALMVTARGGTSDFYFQRFPEYFGDLPIFGGTYASAEATYGVHRDVGTDGVILALNSGFYEFIPESAWEAAQPQTVLPDELNVGDRYRILFTGFNGLYRYDVGDVVEVEGFYNSAPIFIFRHRYGGMLSSVTEKTTEFHLLQTFKRLQAEFQVSLENFCITLSEPEIPPHYLVNIELIPGQTLAQPQQFLRRFDEILAEVHFSYAKRRPEPIPDPRLRILASGSFQQIRQRFIDRGTLESQVKIPHLTEDRHYLDGLAIEREIRL